MTWITLPGATSSAGSVTTSSQTQADVHLLVCVKPIATERLNRLPFNVHVTPGAGSSSSCANAYWSPAEFALATRTLTTDVGFEPGPVVTTLKSSSSIRAGWDAPGSMVRAIEASTVAVIVKVPDAWPIAGEAVARPIANVAARTDFRIT